MKKKILLTQHNNGVEVRLTEIPRLQRRDGTLLSGYSVSIHARGLCITKVQGLGYTDARELFAKLGVNQ